jgi:hypothetical protein
MQHIQDSGRTNPAGANTFLVPITPKPWESDYQALLGEWRAAMERLTNLPDDAREEEFGTLWQQFDHARFEIATRHGIDLSLLQYPQEIEAWMSAFRESSIVQSIRQFWDRAYQPWLAADYWFRKLEGEGLDTRSLVRYLAARHGITNQQAAKLTGEQIEEKLRRDCERRGLIGNISSQRLTTSDGQHDEVCRRIGPDEVTDGNDDAALHSTNQFANSENDLSDRQRLVLEAMLEHEITSERRRKTRAAIVGLINRTHKWQTYNRDFAGLTDRGYLQSREGPRGGVWIKPQQKGEAQRIISSTS